MFKIGYSLPLCLRDRLCPVVNVLLKAVFARTSGEETPGDLGRRSDTCDSIGLNHAKSKSSAITTCQCIISLHKPLLCLASPISLSLIWTAVVNSFDFRLANQLIWRAPPW